MFPFENEIKEQIKQRNHQKIIIELELLDGEPKFMFGVINATDTLINLTNNPKILPQFSDFLGNFHLQILKPMPYIHLVNLTEYKNGKEIDSYQFHIENFKFHHPNVIYTKFPDEMLSDLGKEEGNTVVLNVEAINNFPNPPFNNHYYKIIKNGKQNKSKNLNGYLKINQKEIKIENIRNVHYPKWDLGYEPETDYTAIIRFRNGYTLEYKNNKDDSSIEMMIQGFNFYG